MTENDYQSIINRMLLSTTSKMTLRKSDEWIFFSSKKMDLPSQGWKIHLTATLNEFDKLCNEVLIELINLKVSFKIPSHASHFLKIQAGEYGDTQIGKIVTIYPCNTNYASYLLKILNEKWQDSVAPRVPEEPSTRPNGPVSCRFGDFQGLYKLSSRGVPRRIVYLKDGTECWDDISNTFLLIKELDIQLYKPMGPISNLLEIIENNYAFLSRYNNASSTVIEAIDKKNLKRVVIKQGFAEEKADARNIDKKFQIKNEARILRHLNSYKFPSPTLIDYIESNNESLLIIEHVDGTPLNSALFSKFQLQFEIEKLINLLHRYEIVHADLKETNILVDSVGKLSLIDFGSSGFINEKIPTSTATTGYYDVNKKQLFLTTELDLYSLRSLFFSLKTFCSPSTIVCSPERLSYFSINNPRKSNFTVSKPFNSNEEEFTPLLLSPEKIFNACLDFYDFDTGAWKNKHLFPKYELDSINCGAAGVVLGLLRLRPEISNRNQLDSVIIQTCDRLSTKKHDDYSHGLFSGNTGIAIVLAIAGQVYKKNNYLQSACEIINFALSKIEESDLFSGEAGVLYATIALEKILKGNDFQSLILKLTQSLLQKITTKNGVIGILSSDQKEIESGLAHGSAGLAFALYHVAKYLDDINIEELSLNIFTSIFQKLRTNHCLHFDTSRKMTTANIIWCRGVAGYLWGILNSFGMDARLFDQIHWCRDRFIESIQLHNPTLCHGLAGQLELLKILESVKLINSEIEVIKKVQLCLEGMLIEFDNKQFFLSESHDKVSPDFWVGFTGPASTLSAIKSGRFNPAMTIKDFESIIEHNTIDF